MGLKTLRRPYDSNEDLNKLSGQFYCACEGMDEKDPLCNLFQCDGCIQAEKEQ